MRRHNFKKLRIWLDAIELIDENYKLTATFPDYEKFGLRTQMNRCSVSIASNKNVLNHDRSLCSLREPRSLKVVIPAVVVRDSKK